MSRKSWGLLALTLVTFMLVGLILTDALPLLRGPAPETSEWYWPYLLRPLERWWAPLGAALLMLLTAVFWLHPSREKTGGTRPSPFSCSSSPASCCKWG
ncbi:MAG: hypothetical protein M5U34_14930 [Chloroflexi bacterium]|nr:hypothetical protein [Chloroflexota bacterium]